MTGILALIITARILALLSVVHGAEFLLRRRQILAVWRWRDLAPEIGSALEDILSDRAFVVLNIIRLAVAFSTLLVPTAAGLAILFVLHVLTLIRFLGTYNGGSDSMMLLLLWSSSLGLAFGDKAARVICWYIVFQLCLSYVRAGFVKIKNADWRSGRAARTFIGSVIYESTPLSRKLAGTAGFGGWLVMVFELSFPVSLISPQVALVYMTAGIVFHLANAYLFGLNRFVLSWLAAYPALYLCSQGTL